MQHCTPAPGVIVANCDIMFKILHEINPFEPMSCLETCDVRLIFLLAFFLCPRNYYNDNKASAFHFWYFVPLCHLNTFTPGVDGRCVVSVRVT